MGTFFCMDEKKWLWERMRSVSFTRALPLSSCVTPELVINFSELQFLHPKRRGKMEIIPASQSRLEARSRCLINGSYDYYIPYCPFVLLPHITWYGL